MNFRTKMSRRRALQVGATSAATLASISLTQFNGQSVALAATPPWLDTTQPPLKRANELLAAMNVDQKIQLALSNVRQEIMLIQTIHISVLNALNMFPP